MCRRRDKIDTQKKKEKTTSKWNKKKKKNECIFLLKGGLRYKSRK
jgi:hypothetical protein